MALADTAIGFGLGGRVDGSQYWDGLIDEAFIYRRVLTADEIAWLYNGGIGRTYSDLTPTAAGSLVSIGRSALIGGVR